jgi:hypothetical protein
MLCMWLPVQPGVHGDPALVHTNFAFTKALLLYTGITVHLYHTCAHVFVYVCTCTGMQEHVTTLETLLCSGEIDHHSLQYAGAID